MKKDYKKELIRHAKNTSWDYWVNRPYSPFIGSLSWKWVDAKYFKKVGLPSGFRLSDSLYQYPDLYINSEFSSHGEKILKKYFSNHSMRDLSQILKKNHTGNIIKINKIAKSKISPRKKLKELDNIFLNYIPFIWILGPLEKYFNTLVQNQFSLYIKKDVEKFVGDVSIPKKKNAYVLMQESLTKNSNYKKIQKKFGWLRSRDGFTDFYTIKELMDIKKNIKTAKKLRVIIPKELKGVVRELQELTFFRADRTDKLYEAYGKARPIFEEIAKSIGVPFSDLAYYDVHSIIQGSPKKYDKIFTYIYYKGKYMMKNGIMFPKLGHKNSPKIEGAIAYRGIVRGIAKIVIHPSEMSKVKKGDILISQMTFPSFISAMQKASAFVTDEGSITCHASIVAREMKKPCIIGTKIATQVLKDGDLVEVDADKGIVRIIK